MVNREFDAMLNDPIIELIAGEEIVSPPPVPKHQMLVFQLAKLLENLSADGQVFISPIEVLLDEQNIPQPDVVWLAPQSACRVGETRLEGIPELVIEVLSPSSAKRDRVTKFRLYERAGIKEYWLVDPDGYVEPFSLQDDRYVLLGIYDQGESFASPQLGDVDLTHIFISKGS